MNKATDRKKRSPRRNSNAAIVWRRLLRNKTAMIGLIILVIITLVCLLADVFAPFGYDEQDVMSKFMGPGASIGLEQTILAEISSAEFYMAEDSPWWLALGLLELQR